MKTEKNYSFFKEMKEFIKPYKKKYFLSVILSSFSVLCELLSYSFVGIIAAHIFRGAGFNISNNMQNSKCNFFKFFHAHITQGSIFNTKRYKMCSLR